MGTDGWTAPMLASVGDAGALSREPAGRWGCERKLDGLRCIAVRRGREVALWSRNHLPLTGRFPEVVAALGALAAQSFTIDGELVAFDDDGRSSFASLQRPDRAPAVLCAFDLLQLLGRDTTGLDLPERRSLLTMAVGPPKPALRPPAPLEGDPVELLADACRAGWEGLVAKRLDVPYQSGRSRHWRKLKCHAGQELVVGGWTEPSGGRHGFGALLLGWFDSGDLRYAGRVGTGFDERTLRSIHADLVGLEVHHTPFADAGRVPGAHWARPVLVAEVRFTEWTTDGRLRHPSFVGLRHDVDPTAVRREATR